MTRRSIPRYGPFLLLLSLVVGCPPGLPVGVATHTCALLDDGSVWCWGYNAHGELGDGTSYDRARPVAVAGLPAARAVGAGDGFTCATALDGRAFCWGQNELGQLGDGTTADRATPAPVTGLAGVRTTSVGGEAACAVLETGEVLCWGSLGDATRAPVAVTGLPAAAIDAAVATAYASDLACALLTTGEVWCWGPDDVASIFLGSPATATSIVAGYDGACAVLTDGSVTCANALPGPAATIAGADGRRCAVLTDGAVWCWGSWTRGIEGAPSTSSSPTQYATDATSVAVGANYTCVVRVGGDVACWGDNWAGQLGDGKDRARAAPVPVVGLPGPAAAVTASLGRYAYRSGCGGGTRAE